LITRGQEITIADHDMSFDILATTKKDPNTAKITVYGLSENQRKLFGPGLLVLEFFAGYKDSLGAIFKGSWDPKKSYVTHTKTGPVWQTDIETGDGLKEVQVAFFNRSYPGGTPLLQVLTDVSLSFGIPLIMEFTRPETLLHAATFTGRSSNILDDLAWSYKFDWSIQHGSVLITERDEPSATAGSATILSHSTGLVGDPIVTTDGIECETLMLSTIKPKGLILIKDDTVPTRIEQLANRVKRKKANKLRSGISDSGIYVVDEIQYYGDNRGGDYGCKVKALFQ
jgi:hypothetical protein